MCQERAWCVRFALVPAQSTYGRSRCHRASEGSSAIKQCAKHRHGRPDAVRPPSDACKHTVGVRVSGPHTSQYLILVGGLLYR